jgi:shikimate dehydrogenase
MKCSLEDQFDEVSPGDLGIIGDPVEHSLSPVMQNAGLKTWQNVFRDEGRSTPVYHRFLVKPDELSDAIRLARENKMKGLNVTIPHKVPACSLMDHLEPLAERVGAINTIAIEQDKLVGYNTDGIGFKWACETELGFQGFGHTVLLLGAGGTGRVLFYQLQAMGVSHIYWWNRDPQKVVRIKDATGVLETTKVTHVRGENELKNAMHEAELIVNATGVGMKKGDGLPIPNLLFRKDQLAFDVVYNRDTAFLEQARAAGAMAVGGLGMLVFQGAQSFQIWTGAPAPLEIMRAAITPLAQKDG